MRREMMVGWCEKGDERGGDAKTEGCCNAEG